MPNEKAAPSEIGATELALAFHEAYERLAPQFGYNTRADTKQFVPTTPNGELMIAVCAEILAHVRKQAALSRPEAAPVAIVTAQNVNEICEAMCEPEHDEWDRGYNAGCKDFRDRVKRILSAPPAAPQPAGEWELGWLIPRVKRIVGPAGATGGFPENKDYGIHVEAAGKGQAMCYGDTFEAACRNALRWYRENGVLAATPPAREVVAWGVFHKRTGVISTASLKPQQFSNHDDFEQLPLGVLKARPADEGSVIEGFTDAQAVCILKCRDALVVDDAEEAWHWLYTLDSKQTRHDPFNPWTALERQVAAITPPTQSGTQS